jgi:retron-type reverse transcriptase
MQGEQKTVRTGYPCEGTVEPESSRGARSVGHAEAIEADNAEGLLEAILNRDNLNVAYRKVKQNKGAAGIDGMRVDEMLPYLKEYRDELLERIRKGKYRPKPVRRVEIPKPEGGKRQLGIPTVIDRMLQQAVAQVLEPIFEETFSEYSLPQRNKWRRVKSVWVCHTWEPG